MTTANWRKTNVRGQTLQVNHANDINFKSVSSSIAGGFSGASEVTTAYVNSMIIIIIIFCIKRIKLCSSIINRYSQDSKSECSLSVATATFNEIIRLLWQPELAACIDQATARQLTQMLWCASGCVVECRICNRGVAGSNLGLSSFAPRSTQPSIPPGLVNEYQMRLRRQRQIWLIPIADERVGVQVKSLENTRHNWALLRWCFTRKRRYVKCMHLYLYLYHLTSPSNAFSTSAKAKQRALLEYIV